MGGSGSLLAGSVRAGAGLRELRMPDGSVILEGDAAGRGVATAAVKPAFRVAVRSVGGTPSYRVAIGTINLLVPTGVITWHALANAAHYVVLNVTTDGRQITAAAVADQEAAPPPPECVLGAAPTSFAVPIAYVGPSDDMFVHQIVTGNLVAKREFCHQSERDPIPAGASPWINWWTWAVSEKLDAQHVEL